MANTLDAFFERLTAASGDYNSAVVGELGYLDAVYKDLKPEAVRRGQTIRIPYPDVAAFTDQGAGAWTPEDQNTDYVEMVVDKRPGKAILIHDFEAVQTSSDLINQYLDPCYKRAAEYANGYVGALINTTNFNVYAPLVSSTLGSIAPDDAANAWDLLKESKVPLSGPSDASLIYHTNIHRNMLTDTNWYQENLIGAVIASGTRQDVAAPGTPGNKAFQFNRVFDQQAPVSVTANLTGTVATTAGSATVTGTGTAFMAQAPAGTKIFIDGGTTGYRVKAVGSDTSLTLTQAYPTTATGKNYTRRTFASVAMNKNAIALAVRPLELVNAGNVTSRLLLLKGLPIRVMMSYQHLAGGWLMTMDFAMGAKVIRPDFGVVITS